MQPRTIAAIAAFTATVPLANWMIGNVGTCLPNGPCVIPVGFGFMAPSGVLVIGAALVLRDLVHEKGGALAALIAILIGGLVSGLVADPRLALASVIAFVAGELADLIVYAPLRRNRLALALLLSGIAGSIIDSAVFLLLAFGSLDLIVGQVLGKTWASLAAALVLISRRRPLWQTR